MLEYIDPFVFIVSLGIGIFLAYIMHPGPTIVYKYPNLSNVGKVTYVDDTGVCYKYHSTEVAVPSIDSEIKKME